MSFYATIQGEITYQKKKDFSRIYKFLKKNKWIKDNRFIGETKNSISGYKDIDEKEKIITIPYGHYRNLARIFNKFFEGGEGRIIATSTDGCFEGYIIINGKETVYNLNDWAKENIEDDPPDYEEDFDVYCEWMSKVENTFFEQFGD
jgi:hypothetical protein